MVESLKSLMDIVDDNPVPPLEDWQPKHRGKIDILIDEEGQWYHEGTAFTRKDLMRMFSRILVCEDDDYFLKTPVEQLLIQVNDVPFVITLMRRNENNEIECVTQCGDEILIDAQHPMEVRMFKGQLVPYVLVRSNLWARFSRNAYYQLMDEVVEEGSNLGVKSGQLFYSLEG